MTNSQKPPAHARQHATPPFQQTARWLLPAVAFLVLYGSLYPFEFNEGASRSLLARLVSLRFAATWRGDIVANLLLYMPLGLCLAAALGRKWRALPRLTVAVLVGSLLSLAIEVVQTMEVARVASLSDLALNAAGTAIGAVGALVYQSLGAQLRLPGLFDGRPAPVPLGFVVLWLSCRLAPFVPTLDWQKVKDALKPLLLAPEFSLFDALRFLVGWLVFAHAVRWLWKPSHALIVLIVLVAATQVGRIFVVGKILSLSELAGILAMFLLLPVLARLEATGRLLLLVGAVAVVVVAQGLEPWQFTSVSHDFSWIPFRNSLSDSLEVNMSALFEKVFWYAALVWLLSSRIGALVGCTLFVAALVTGVECLQIWLPGRSAEITDPLIVLGAGALIGLLGREQPPAARPSMR